jgi:hypothetical protein
MDAFVDSDNGKTANLTIGSTTSFAGDKNAYRLCVRGKLICKASNTGYTNYTLFHCVEQEGSVDAGQLENRVFEWTGIPRVQDPETGAAVGNWKDLHSGHALSSVQLCTGHNSKAVAGVLHNVAAAQGDTTFLIHGAHGDNEHEYHGERPLLRVASSGDHLVWCVKGSAELHPELLSGRYEKFVNGVAQAEPVFLQCNHDLSFTLSENVPSILAKIAELEAIIATLTAS